jgi:hypothetical protein
MAAASNKSVTTVVSAMFLGLGLGAGPAAATDLYIAGTLGEVYQGDSETGGFQLFGGICLGSIQALAMDDSFIYAGDNIGGIIQVDLDTGVFVNIFFAPDSISAMVMHDGDLLVSEVDGDIHRIDPTTGLVESTLLGPYGVEAMLVLGDDLYVSSAIEGIIWKGNAVSGEFEYFGCGCSGPALGMANNDLSLYVADGFGQYVRYDLATGFLMDEGFLPFGTSAMVMDGEDLLLSEPDGTIHRIDPVSWLELDTMISPVTIETMLLDDAVSVFADIDGDGIVGINDFLALLGAWGPCPAPPEACPADLDNDGYVRITDFLLLLGNWTL